MARTLKATDPKAAKPSKPKILVFGQPNTRKTSVALDFPSTYYIDCEGGANLPYYTDKLKKSGGMYMGPDLGANDFDVVNEEIITLSSTSHKFRTLVVDSYSKLFNTRVSNDYERMERAQRDMEKTFGAEKKGAINATRRMIRLCEHLDMTVILICHERDVWKDNKVVGVSFDGWDKLAYELHLNLQIIKQGTSYKAKVMKTRLGGFPDAATFDWSYDEFATRYGREVLEASATPVAMATPEQIAEYEHLVQVVKIPPKVKEKWDEVESVSDLTHAELQSRINQLNKQLEKAAQ